MNSKSILARLIKIAQNQHQALRKLAQMGAGEEINFTSPQYFAPICHSLFKKICNNENIHITINTHSVMFMDSSGELSSQELKNLLKDCCHKIERELNRKDGEIFDYKNTL